MYIGHTGLSLTPGGLLRRETGRPEKCIARNDVATRTGRSEVCHWRGSGFWRRSGDAGMLPVTPHATLVPSEA